MEIECQSGQIETIVMEWSGAEDTWRTLMLDHLWSFGAVVERVAEIEILIDHPDLEGWDSTDPNSYSATISIGDELSAKRGLYAAMIDLAHENRDKLATLLSTPTGNFGGYSDLDEQVLHSGAAAFTQRK
jgi:hypothetical protein